MAYDPFELIGRTNPLIRYGLMDRPKARRRLVPTDETNPDVLSLLRSSVSRDALEASGIAEPEPYHPRQSSTPDLTPEEQHSLLENLGQTGMGALQYTGETLDKPAAAVRGIVSGVTGGKWGGGLLNLIPFSDTLGITNPEERVQPEDLTGLKSEESDDFLSKAGKFGANLATGVALDPLFWLPGGILGAASRAGKAAKATDLLSKGTDFSKLASQIGKVAPEEAATMGRRVFMQKHTLADLLKAAPDEGAPAANSNRKGQ